MSCMHACMHVLPLPRRKHARGGIDEDIYMQKRVMVHLSSYLQAGKLPFIPDILCVSPTMDPRSPFCHYFPSLFFVYTLSLAR